MRIPRRDLFTIIFALLTLTITAVAIVSIADYSQFFPALSGLQVKLASLNWHIVNGTMSQLITITNVSFTVENPTGYTGLTLRGFQPTLDIPNTTIPATVFGVEIITSPLDPGKPTTINFPDYNVSQGAVTFWRQTHNIQFRFFNDFLLSSLLNHVGSLKVTYLCASSGGPKACEQTAISISTASLPLPGGGG